MPTNAKISFDENWSNIESLMELTGANGKRNQKQIAAQNQAALSFCITAWEAYVEDAAKDAASYLAMHCQRFNNLPKPVQKSLIKKVTPIGGPGTKTLSGKYIHDLMDDGWRTLLREFVTEATFEGNFNTPSSKNVAELFWAWCGIDVTTKWAWQNFAAPGPANRLDESIRIRGSIVHTGQKPSGINKNWIHTYGTNNICTIVEKTDAALIEHVNQLCGKTDDSPSFGSLHAI